MDYVQKYVYSFPTIISPSNLNAIPVAYSTDSPGSPAIIASPSLPGCLSVTYKQYSLGK